jgi:hypothetical protein
MQSDSDSSGDNEAVTKKGKRGNDDHGALKTDALQAGKRYAVCDELWIDPAAIRHIVYVSKSGSDTELLSDGPEEVKEQAKSILKSLPAALRPHIGTRWFRERVRATNNMPCFTPDYFYIHSLKRVAEVFAPAKSTFSPICSRDTSSLIFQRRSLQTERSDLTYLKLLLNSMNIASYMIVILKH